MTWDKNETDNDDERIKREEDAQRAGLGGSGSRCPECKRRLPDHEGYCSLKPG
jgi:hypothetical protein